MDLQSHSQDGVCVLHSSEDRPLPQLCSDPAVLEPGRGRILWVGSLGLSAQTPVDEPVLQVWIESSVHRALFMCEMKVSDQSEVLRPTCASGSPGGTRCVLFSGSTPDLLLRSWYGAWKSCIFKDPQMIHFSYKSLIPSLTFSLDKRK